jgi:hypothetical protein
LILDRVNKIKGPPCSVYWDTSIHQGGCFTGTDEQSSMNIKHVLPEEPFGDGSAQIVGLAEPEFLNASNIGGSILVVPLWKTMTTAKLFVVPPRLKDFGIPELLRVMLLASTRTTQF